MPRQINGPIDISKLVSIRQMQAMYRDLYGDELAYGTAYMWSKRNSIPSVKIVNRVCFFIDDALEMLARLRVRKVA